MPPGAMLSTMLGATKGDGELADAGLMGRLGDLGVIEKKYDVAVSTACGSLDNLVTETTSGAEACVKFLKKHDLGRSTFIIMEKLGYLKKNMSPVDTPEGVPRLFDLIECANPDLRAAFTLPSGILLLPKTSTKPRIAYKGSACGGSFPLVIYRHIWHNEQGRQ